MLLQLICVVTLAGTVFTVPADVSPETQVLKANSEFANDFYKAVSEGTQDNVLVSPLSAHACLSMLYQGTAGATKEACAQALKVGEPNVVAQGYSSLLDDINNNIIKNVTVNIANKMYVSDSTKLKNNFENVLTQSYKSQPELIDFTDKEAAARKINEWAKEKTKGKISEVFKKDEISRNALVVLLNVIYFKGKWAYQFYEETTKTEEFYVDQDNKIDVQMMNRAFERLLYKECQHLDAQIIELPFKDRRYSMIFVLPNQKSGISDLENKLTSSDLSNILEGAETFGVIASLPKFSFSQTIQLNDVLKKLGLGILFDDEKCDLSEMVNLPAIVSKAIQKTFIKVEEKGCEAAAITASESTPSSGFVVKAWKTFKADHPFMFLLVQKPKDQTSLRNIHFYGKVKKPQTENI